VSSLLNIGLHGDAGARQIKGGRPVPSQFRSLRDWASRKTRRIMPTAESESRRLASGLFGFSGSRGIFTATYSTARWRVARAGRLAKARKPINARSETVARLPLFKETFARRRCLVPAAAYYEWRHDPSGKTPFAIARSDGEPVALGGMWEVWRSPEGETLRTFATLTTDANPTLALIQDRMPVIIERTDWPLWLGEADGDVTALLRPPPADQLRIWPIERTVNNVRNDGPELLVPSSLPDEQPVLGLHEL
jgi:putative SOS response-associated peptidase YedK